MSEDESNADSSLSSSSNEDDGNLSSDSSATPQSGGGQVGSSIGRSLARRNKRSLPFDVEKQLLEEKPVVSMVLGAERSSPFVNSWIRIHLFSPKIPPSETLLGKEFGTITISPNLTTSCFFRSFQ
jgi:hypothetical protein